MSSGGLQGKDDIQEEHPLLHELPQIVLPGLPQQGSRGWVSSRRYWIDAEEARTAEMQHLRVPYLEEGGMQQGYLHLRGSYLLLLQWDLYPHPRLQGRWKQESHHELPHLLQRLQEKIIRRKEERSRGIRSCSLHLSNSYLPYLCPRFDSSLCYRINDLQDSAACCRGRFGIGRHDWVGNWSLYLWVYEEEKWILEMHSTDDTPSHNIRGYL